MLRLGFCEEWVELVISCVRTVDYSICMNGNKGESFQPHRGLRQGDPLNPYLFLSCLEGFSSLLKLAKSEGIIKGVKVGRSNLALTHFFLQMTVFCLGKQVWLGLKLLRLSLENTETNRASLLISKNP